MVRSSRARRCTTRALSAASCRDRFSWTPSALLASGVSKPYLDQQVIPACCWLPRRACKGSQGCSQSALGGLLSSWSSLGPPAVYTAGYKQILMHSMHAVMLLCYGLGGAMCGIEMGPTCRTEKLQVGKRSSWRHGLVPLSKSDRSGEGTSAKILTRCFTMQRSIKRAST